MIREPVGVFGAAAQDAVRCLISYVGEDVKREGLVETPERVVRAWLEMTGGYHEQPAEILSKVFDVPTDEMVVVGPIEFWSTCEHHMLPFHGTAHVGYIPQGKVVGLSKIPRLVRCFSRRLQVQERLTQEIANAMNEHLAPTGVGVVLRGTHLCMAARGVRSASTMTTSCLLGAMRDSARARSEFLALCR